MTPNNQSRYNQEEQTRIQTDPLNNTPNAAGMVNQPRVDEGKKAAYHDGYVHGQVRENYRQERDLVERDNNNAARGLLLGIILMSLLGLVAGAIYFWKEQNEETYEPANTTPVVVPSASPAPRVEKETTIIERAIPIPQPAPQQTTTPEVNITPQLENPEPAETNPTNSTPTVQPNINITVPNSQTREAPPTQPDAGVSNETGVVPENEPVNETPDNTQTDNNSSSNPSPSIPNANLSGGSNQ